MSETLLTLREAKASNAEAQVTFIGKISSIGKIESYKITDQQQERRYITMTVADKSDIAVIRIYQINKITTLEPG